MANSTVPAFMAALLTALKARPGLSSTQVAWGVPRGELQKEFMLLLDVDGEQTTKAKGQHRREEQFDLTVVISVVRTRGEAQAATERAYVLAAELENELRTNTTMTSTVRNCRIEGRFALNQATPREGDRTEAMLTVTVRANERI